MMLRGKIKGNTVVLEDAANLPPDGTEVLVYGLAEAPVAQESAHAGSFLEEMGEFLGCIPDLPEDFADQHDHYIHGTPKRESA